MKSSSADLIARVILGFLIVAGLMSIGIYSFGIAMMTLPLILSGIFLALFIVTPFILVFRAFRKKKDSDSGVSGSSDLPNEGAHVLWRKDD